MSALTVKWVILTREGTIERIFPADEVAVGYHDESVQNGLQLGYAPGYRGIITLGEPDEQNAEQAALLINPNDDRTCKRLGCGTCYVMNEAGRTVGSYNLDGVDVNGSNAAPNVRSSDHKLGCPSSPKAA